MIVAQGRASRPSTCLDYRAVRSRVAGTFEQDAGCRECLVIAPPEQKSYFAREVGFALRGELQRVKGKSYFAREGRFRAGGELRRVKSKIILCARSKFSRCAANCGV